MGGVTCETLGAERHLGGRGEGGSGYRLFAYNLLILDLGLQGNLEKRYAYLCPVRWLRRGTEGVPPHWARLNVFYPTTGAGASSQASQKCAGATYERQVCTANLRESRRCESSGFHEMSLRKLAFQSTGGVSAPSSVPESAVESGAGDGAGARS